ncbi:MAG: hypothetical protein NW237_00960 [Cyanobacteriota bacterium]|nr:hypothetical protein [Cyanobacteriota bacterium]
MNTSMTRVWSVALAGVLSTGLVGCGSDDDGGIVISPTPSTSAPTVTIVNPPSSVRFGQTAFFTVQVNAPGGVRSSQFLQIRIVDPNGQQFGSITSLNPNQFGNNCVAGSTFCTSSDLGFQAPSNGPSGFWTLTFTAFDQSNRSGASTVGINVVP